MRVLFTGQTGIDKKAVLQRLVKLCTQNGRAIRHVYHVGEMMYEHRRKVGRPLREGKILDLPLAELASLRRAAFLMIGSTTQPNDDVFVNSHAVFRWDNKVFTAFEFTDFEDFRPDAVVTLVDDVDAVKMRLDGLKAQGGLPRDTRYTLKDLLVWREEEVLASRLLAQFLGSPHYLAGVYLEPDVDPEPLSTAHSLLFEPWKKKAYVSYPISDAQGKPDVWAKVVQFRRLVRKYLTAFDPLVISEGRLKSFLGTASTGSGMVQVPGREGVLNLAVNEISAVIPDIDGQITARDYALIDQAEMIVAYFPLDTDRTPLIAAGVQSEIEHAAASTKEVVIVWEAQKTPTPFIGRRADHQFSSLQELEAFLKDAFNPVGQPPLTIRP